jgi:hypothetical protein
MVVEEEDAVEMIEEDDEGVFPPLPATALPEAVVTLHPA